MMESNWALSSQDIAAVNSQDLDAILQTYDRGDLLLEDPHHSNPTLLAHDENALHNSVSIHCDEPANLKTDWNAHNSNIDYAPCDSSIPEVEDKKIFRTCGNSTDVLPSVEDYIGEFGFIVKPEPSSRGSWIYSHSLDQVFIDINKVLVIKFELHNKYLFPDELLSKLFIRAVPVYSQPDHIKTPVNRCVFHSAEDDPSKLAHDVNSSGNGELCRCVDYKLVGHVVRTQMEKAIYCYNEISGRHSVLVPLQSMMSEMFSTPPYSFTIPYVFKCKTSCHSGMERRQINLVFTLEDENFNVIGRKAVLVKVCSCPKRDKDRLEKLNMDSDDNALNDRRRSHQQTHDMSNRSKLHHHYYHHSSKKKLKKASRSETSENCLDPTPQDISHVTIEPPLTSANFQLLVNEFSKMRQEFISYATNAVQRFDTLIEIFRTSNSM